MKVVFLIYQLAVGGSERQIVALAKGMKEAGIEVAILCFYSGGALEADAKAAQIRVVGLDKKSRWDLVGFMGRLHGFLRQEKPDALHSYLSPANIVSVLIKPFFPRLKVVWGLRATISGTRNDRFDRPIFHAEKTLSRFADLIVHNSNAGRVWYAGQGFSDRKAVVIPNGIDIRRFVPDASARLRIRQELAIPDTTPVFGIVARFDPMKGYPVFFKAASDFLRTGHEAHFVLVGPGVTGDNPHLTEQMGTCAGDSHFHLLGERHDIPAVLCAFDVYTSSSVYGEGFSNSVGEAMACGVPCVVTDIGDSAFIVEETGIVVPPGNPEALAQGWQTMLDRLACDRAAIQEQTRARMVEHFSVEHLVEQTRQDLSKLIGR